MSKLEKIEAKLASLIDNRKTEVTIFFKNGFASGRLSEKGSRFLVETDAPVPFAGRAVINFVSSDVKSISDSSAQYFHDAAITLKSH